jgi:hypothetical protein
MIEHVVLALSLAFNGWIVYRFVIGHRLIKV